MPNSVEAEYMLIRDYSDLKKIMPELQAEPVIGVDLEADSMFHYQERVCLVQISTGRLNLLVDPLSIEDLSPLAPVFADNRIKKVFHGADYDIRSLARDFGIEVSALFDTQIAARFLGMRETGLASLLHEKFHVKSNKKYQKKDWSQRPLPEPMLEYAVQDICYLIALADMLEKELMEKDRLFCVREECELLSRVQPNSFKKSPFFPGFKGAAKLDPRSLAVLENILVFRDQEARRRDRPHFKVLGNNPIMEICRIKPLSRSDLTGIKDLSPKQIDLMGGFLIEEVRKGMDLAEEMLPVYPKKVWHRLKSKETLRVKQLKMWRERIGGQWGVDPAVICTNAQIEAISIANPEKPGDMESIEEVRKWQTRLFGAELCDILKETG